ncbi:MAG: hypothetical protein HY586_04855 [Candidatus Omnitrophica bacterium]|nr:hypothetical protein [Candidatus Omnitrophota bacterium]
MDGIQIKRGKLKTARKFFAHGLSARTIRAKHINMPFRIFVDDILTGYMGEKMHANLYQLKKIRNHSHRVRFRN